MKHDYSRVVELARRLGESLGLIEAAEESAKRIAGREHAVARLEEIQLGWAKRGVTSTAVRAAAREGRS